MVSITKSTKPVREKDIQRDWYVVDLSKKPLGRVITDIVTLIQGKHKTYYAPNLDVGDYVVVVNASNIQTSGKKKNTKIYTAYSGFPGGLKVRTFSYLSVHKPEEIVKHAVSGMLPKNKLRAKRLARLFVYKNEEHPHKDKIRSTKSEVPNYGKKAGR